MRETPAAASVGTIWPKLEVSLTYKGEKSMSRAIGAALKGQGILANAGRKVDGTRVTICLEGPCP